MNQAAEGDPGDRKEHSRRAAAGCVPEDSPVPEEDQNNADKGDEGQVCVAIVAPCQGQESCQGLSKQQQGDETERQKPEMVGGEPCRILANGPGYCGGC